MRKDGKKLRYMFEMNFIRTREPKSKKNLTTVNRLSTIPKSQVLYFSVMLQTEHT